MKTAQSKIAGMFHAALQQSKEVQAMVQPRLSRR